MCGICGICASGNSDGIELRTLEAMSDALSHRGPDGNGLFLKSCVALGHRRLSIIDLAGGGQPMSNDDGSLTVVFNGEIYNYVELRRDLCSRGRQFRTDSDTEVLLHLYEESGDKCLAALNGMFAFALWDGRRRRLFAARDRMGEKPLYYCVRNGKLLFASELKSLMQYPGFEPSLDATSLDEYLAFGYVPAPHTIFKDVHKLPAAHALVWEHGGLRTYRYWEPAVPPADRLTEQEYVDELKRRLEASVQIRLRSDVPLGAFLSGGIDSSAIVALASMQHAESLETFSVGFDFQEFDESPYARAVAERYRTRHHQITVSDLDVSIFGELVQHFDEPFADPSAIPTYYVAREAKRFVTVCLSGDGGDELFAGYDRYHEPALERLLGRAPRSLRRHLLEPLAGAWPERMRGKGLLERAAAIGAERYQRHVGIFDPPSRQRLLRQTAQRDSRAGNGAFERFFNENGRDEVAIRQLTDQLTYLPEDVLVKVDRTSMKSALEVRVPFLDHTVVEWVNAMPTDMKLRGGCSKYILKRMLHDLLPADILQRPKRGFGIPIRNWLRGDLVSFAHDLLLSPNSRCARLFDRAELSRLVERHQRGPRDLSRRLWALLWLEQWCRCFGM